MSYNISIRLDKRRAKDNGKYPIKLRVYYNKVEKWYSLDIDLTNNEFNTIWVNSKNKNLRGTNKDTRLKLQAIENRANKEAEQLNVFDFATFEMKLFRKSSDKNSVKYHFNNIIESNFKKNKIGTAESYKYTLKSLEDFSQNKNNCNIDKLKLEAINVNWLNEYEKHMLSKGKSYTTINIYLKTLFSNFYCISFI